MLNKQLHTKDGRQACPARFLLPGFFAVLACAALLSAQSISFTVSIDRPQTFHVSMRCDGLKGEIHDFKMPVWMPGFYRVMDYAKYVSGFKVIDAANHPLAWEKTTKNTWRVVAGGAATVTLDYDVAATANFPASSSVGEDRAYLAPPGTYMSLDDQIHHAATVAFKMPAAWSHIATGLDPVAGKPNTFSAPDFDLLFDSPILLGNQEILRFDVKKIPHWVVIEKMPASVDRQKVLADLKQIVETATALVGDIPYQHYTFLMIGQGNGGIEHTNSASIFFNGNSLTNANGYEGWLSYVTHEYFHNFNVKRIRPLALGPFDYDRENYTNMLWVSEGLSVYYQDLILVRAGLMTPEQYLAKMTRTIAGVENSLGHRYESTTESSWYTWGNSGVGLDRNTSISYYDKGPALGVLLDLKIRELSKNRHSLDDVMRALYRTYYIKKQRGFTDTEFQQECESAAGGPLPEVFEYASTTKEIDYAKYFAIAGLAIDTMPAPGDLPYLGINFRMMEGKLGITSVLSGSPAEKAGITTADEVIEVENVPANPKSVNDAMVSKGLGSKLKLRLARGPVEVAIEPAPKRTYKISVERETDIYKDWLRSRQ